jgi:prevent-host-death family protein
MTATDAARSFSDVLNRVASGEEIEVLRSGAPVAVITAPKSQLLSAARFRELIAAAPRPDDEFAADVLTARSLLPGEVDPWPS